MALYKFYKSTLFAVITIAFLTYCRPVDALSQQSTSVKDATAPGLASATSKQPAINTLIPSVHPSKTVQQSPSPAAGGTTLYLPTIVTPAPSITGDLFADYRVIDQFSSIPDSALSAASAKRVSFYHQSTGGYIEYYWSECLAGHLPNLAECNAYSANPNKYAWTNWTWILWPQPMANAINKMDQFVSEVPSQGNADIIGMKFCYVDGWNQDFDNYRIHMEQLESAYPGKTFIWSTSALWADPGDACDPSNPFNSCRLIQEFNDQLRAYAKANNKPLYDIASIESNGGVCQTAGYEGLCAQYYGDDGGGHPNELGGVRLAKGFWWLIARLSGWTP